MPQLKKILANKLFIRSLGILFVVFIFFPPALSGTGKLGNWLMPGAIALSPEMPTALLPLLCLVVVSAAVGFKSKSKLK